MIVDKKYIPWREQCNLCDHFENCSFKFKKFLQALNNNEPIYILHGYYCNKNSLNEEKYNEWRLKCLNSIKMK